MPSSINMSVLFDESGLTPNMVVTDTEDYAALGLTASNFRVHIKVSLASSAGTVVVYDNLAGGTPDINLSVSNVSVLPIPLPVDADGNVLLGDYTVDLLKQDVIGLAQAPFTQTHVFSYTEPNPDMKLAITIDCGNSKITSKDITNYGNNYSGLSRVHKLYPPAQLGFSPYSNALDTLVVTGIYTTTYTAEVVTTYTYNSTLGYSFTKKVSAVREFKVDCDTNLCTILCCLSNIKKTYDYLLNNNTTQASIIKTQMIDPCMENLMWFFAAQQCGDINKMAQYKDAIVEITNCGTDCNCSTTNDNAVQVIPTAGVDLITVVDSPDNSLAVTTQVVGNTTIYHVQLSNTIQNLINSFYTTAVDSNTPSLINVTSSGSSPKTYHVDFAGTIPVLPKQAEIQINIFPNPDPLSGVGFAVLTASYIILNGTNWKTSVSQVYTIGTSSPNVDTDLALISLSNILNNGSYTYLNAHAQINKTHISVSTVATPFFVEVFSTSNTSTGGVTLRFIDEFGVPINLKALLRSSSGVLVSLSLYNL